jgi:vacuolar protein-sorting-associated protein 4
VTLPDDESRLQLIRSAFADIPHSLSEDQMETIADRMNGYSCSDIGVVCRSASMQPVRRLQTSTHFCSIIENNTIVYIACDPSQEGAIRKSLSDFTRDEHIAVPHVTMDDLEISLMHSKPSVGEQDLENYDKFTKDFGQST